MTVWESVAIIFIGNDAFPIIGGYNLLKEQGLVDHLGVSGDKKIFITGFSRTSGKAEPRCSVRD